MFKIYYGDALDVLQKEINDKSIDIILTSPPFWGLRDYGIDSQIGQESTVEEYIANLLKVFDQCKRVLVNDGLFFLNIGDTYFGYWGNSKCGDNKPPSSRSWYNENSRPKFKPDGWKKDKQKGLIPFRLAIGLQEQGWIVRNDIVWHKPNFRPEKVQGRMNCTNEYWFFCVKNSRTKKFSKGGLAFFRKPTKNDIKSTKFLEKINYKYYIKNKDEDYYIAFTQEQIHGLNKVKAR